MKLKKGFTYIELIMSLSIGSILASAALPNLERLIETRRALQVVENTRVLNLAVSDVFRLNGITNETFIYCGSYRYDELEAMIAGGFDAMEVAGYWFTLNELDNCKMYIEHFKGVEASNLYQKL